MANTEFNLAELEARTKRLMERLAAAPVVELVGLVGALGPGGGQSRGETLWTMLLTLEAWRIGTGEMQTRKMTVRYQVTEDHLHSLQHSIKPYSVLRMRARVVDDPQYVRPEAKLEGIPVVVVDAELAELARKLQEPVTCEDPFFGILTLDRQLDRHNGNAIWNGQSVRIDLGQDDSGRIESGLSTLRALWDDQQRWRARINDYAVQELLPLKNETWLDEDEAPLSAEEFKTKMKLDAISVDQDSFTFWHTDGDMFLGHTIQICGTLSEGPTSADIPG